MTARRNTKPRTPNLIPLTGARMVRVSEPETGALWQEGLVKELTGGEPIKVRTLPARFFDFQPEFRLRISGRDTPGSRGPSR